jgi:hypothetical protein
MVAIKIPNCNCYRRSFAGITRPIPKRSIPIAQEYVHRTGCAVGSSRGQIQFPIVVEIAHADGLDSERWLRDFGILEGSVAIAQQNADAFARIV